MHQSLHLRQMIAQEAARLLTGGYVSDFSKARLRAARQMFRGRLAKEELPTFAEIQAFMLQQRVENGATRQTPLHLQEELICSLKNLTELLQDDRMIVERLAEKPMILPGYCLRVYSQLESELIEEILIDAGNGLSADLLVMCRETDGVKYFRLKTQHLEFEIYSITEEFHVEGISVEEYLEQIESTQQDGISASEVKYQESLLDWSYAFELLPLLSGVRVDSYEHPEGDLCYHAQQVYQLGYEIEPYDAEFLEACLFHDLGYLRNYHAPQAASVSLLTGLATERTLFFISELQCAHEYLRTD